MRRSRLAAQNISAAMVASICKRYQSGEASTALAKELGFSGAFIAGLLRKSGVAIRPRNGNPKLSQEQQAGMIADYGSGMTTYECAEKYGIKACSVWEFLRRRQLTRNTSDSKRIYSLNRTAFSAITDESAYWIGFLITDGCVSDGKYPVLSLSLAENDSAHVDKFRAFLGSTHPIKTIEPRRSAKSYNSTPQSIISLRIPPQMKNDLARHGVIPRKTHVAKTSAEMKCNPHFWRGAIDGDGTVFMSESSGALMPSISLASASIEFAEQFRKFIRLVINKEPPKITTGNGAVKIGASGRSGLLVINALYGISGISLDRKGASAQKILNHHARNPGWCYDNRSAKSANSMRASITPESLKRMGESQRARLAKRKLHF